MQPIAKTPKPPYYAVIFTSHRTEGDDNGYSETAAKMVELASRQDGFLGIESARSGLGITVSYWRDLDAIDAWRRNATHLNAKERGKDDWYTSFITRISLVERDYGNVHD